MENCCCRKVVAFIIFFLLFFFHGHHRRVNGAVSISGKSLTGSLPLVKNLFLACGSSGNSIGDDDDEIKWVGDVNSGYSPIPSATVSTIQPRQSPYSYARLSLAPFTYTFNLTAGQKFIRLHFYPASYQDAQGFHFNTSQAFFSVKAGSFTLLKNFSASLTAAASGQQAFFEEFCINIQEQDNDDDNKFNLFNITFTPSTSPPYSYALVNGIEIVSMPSYLYYTDTSDIDSGFEFVGVDRQYSILNNNAVQNLYRVNVGGTHISPSQDVGGMYRTWVRDDDYLTDARPSVAPVNTTIVLDFSQLNGLLKTMLPTNYSAPPEVYNTGRSMGWVREINEHYNLTWEFEVDSGFTYVVRLHFCEFQTDEINKIGDRVFRIYIANLTAELEADVIRWSGGNGVPIYRDYAVAIGSSPNYDQRKVNLSIKLHPAPRSRTNYSDAILNGLEIFKVDTSGNLAGPNPELNPMSVIPSSSPPSTKGKKNKKITGIVAGIVSGFGVLSLLSLVIWWFVFGRPRRKEVKDSGSGSSTKEGTSFWGQLSSYGTTTKSAKGGGSFLPSDLCTHFSISQIKEATNNFNNVLLVGVGGFGNVYKGFISSSDQPAVPVAIKRLNPESQQGILEFQTEIGMLSQLRHLHLVSLIGYCDDDREMILVYDFMARGTLRDHLYNNDNPPLPWNQRLQICIGAARGLHYLHTGAKHVIIHRDVKSTNILLDEKWVAKVSDFGLSKFGPNSVSKTHVSTVVKGSFGYLDPEYYRLQQLTEKSDVYSFGVVLFEVLCARPPILRTADKKQVSLAVWAQQCYRNGTLHDIIDPFLKGVTKPECINKFAEVAMSCLNDDGIRRPSMSDVVWGLEFALQLLQECSTVYLKGDHERTVHHDRLCDDQEVDDDSAYLFARLGDHVLDSKTMSTTTDDQNSSTLTSGAAFSEIFNPKGR